jgi:hypothetical protein
MRLVNGIAFLIIVLFTVVCMAQQPATVGLPDFPVPAWPANGVVPADMKDKYVFVDPAKNEYIVAFPENLGSTDYEKDGPGAMKVNRFELLRNVEPVVNTTIAPMNGGKLRYTYEVANGSTAKQTIDQWSLIIPQAANTSTIKFPEGWMAVVQLERSFKVPDPDWIRTGAAAVWSFKKPEQVIQAGDKKTGFILESDLRPGFTLGYFRKAESVDVTVAAAGNNLPAVPGAAAGGRGGRGGRGAPAPETPPVDPELQKAAQERVEALKDQIDEILMPEYNSKTVLMIGPKFEKDTDAKTVAADFVRGLTLLSQTGGVDANSDFVKDMLEQLKAVESSGNTSAFKPMAQPKTPAETQVFNAFKVSLQAN